MVAREMIIAYNARTFHGGDPSGARDASHTLHKAYSGFVHGAAQHILELYGGTPRRPMLAGCTKSSMTAIARCW